MFSSSIFVPLLFFVIVQSSSYRFYSRFRDSYKNRRRNHQDREENRPQQLLEDRCDVYNPPIQDNVGYPEFTEGFPFCFIPWRVYIFYGLSVCVCVRVCVCLSVLNTNCLILHWLGLNPFNIGDLRSKIKVRVTSLHFHDFVEG